jgi:hypothetical protein
VTAFSALCKVAVSCLDLPSFTGLELDSKLSPDQAANHTGGFRQRATLKENWRKNGQQDKRPQTK